MLSPKTEDVLAFALTAHAGQVRKHHQEPYWCHLCDVAGLVQEWAPAAGVDTALAVHVALLHDVLEDTSVTLTEIVSRFGDEVGRHVLACTLDPRDTRRRADRKAAFNNQLRTAGAIPQLVKICDAIDNLEDLPADAWRGKYAQEKVDLLQACPDLPPDLQDVFWGRLSIFLPTPPEPRLGDVLRVLRDFTLRDADGSVQVHAGDIVICAGNVDAMIGPAGPDMISVVRIEPFGLMRLPLRALVPLEKT